MLLQPVFDSVDALLFIPSISRRDAQLAARERIFALKSSVGLALSHKVA